MNIRRTSIRLSATGLIRHGSGTDAGAYCCNGPVSSGFSAAVLASDCSFISTVSCDGSVFSVIDAESHVRLRSGSADTSAYAEVPAVYSGRSCGWFGSSSIFFGRSGIPYTGGGKWPSGQVRADATGWIYGCPSFDNFTRRNGSLISHHSG